MLADAATAADRKPRRARYLIPRNLPRRGEVLAACAIAAILAHLAFAQLTILLAAVLYAVTKASGWRPTWLAVPAGSGLLWTLAIGPAAAWAGFTDGPGRVASYFGGISQHQGRLLHLGTAYTGMGHWLPRQLPLALIAATAEAACAAWLSWLHTDEWDLPDPRPGLIILGRRAVTVRTVRSGGVVTKDGGCLGLTPASGARATLSWREAAGGVLCAGSPRSGTTTTSFQLVHAAIRRRKPVIAVDLAGDRGLAAAFSAACAATNTPLHIFGPAGTGCYEPLRHGEPARRAALVMGMIDWSGVPDQHRRSCGAYLNDAFAVMDAAPGDPRVATLDELGYLLGPSALRARMGSVPAYHPRGQVLAERVRVSASLLESDPGAAAALAAQLSELRASPLGRWLSPGPPGDHIDLGRVVRERAVVLFSLDWSAYGRAAAGIASLVSHDAIAVCADLRRIGVDGDGLIWLDQCGPVAAELLTELASRGADAGLPLLLTTTSEQVADGLADHVNALVIHRMAAPAVAESFARRTGEKLAPGGNGTGRRGTGRNGDGRDSKERNGAGHNGSGPAVAPAVAAQAFSALREGEFVLVVKRPRRRLLPLGKTVPACPLGTATTLPFGIPSTSMPHIPSAASPDVPLPQDAGGFGGSSPQAGAAGGFGPSGSGVSPGGTVPPQAREARTPRGLT